MLIPMTDGDDIDGRRVRAFLAGDREAFDELARAHRDRIYRICYRYTGTREDAEDLTQDVLVRVYRGLSSFRAEARLSTWLYRIAVNVCLNWIASRKVVEALPESLAQDGPSTIERLAASERAETVRRAVLELPERQRLTLVLRVYEELSHKEIADAMDCPVGTAKANLFFALKNLRKKLAEKGVES